MKTSTLFLALTILSHVCFAQNSRVDSLRQLIGKSHDAGREARVLEELCFRFFIASQPDSIAPYQSKLQSVLKNNNDLQLSALSDFYKIQIISSKDSAEFFRLSSIALNAADEIKCNQCIALHYLANGLVYRKFQQFSLAVASLKEGIESIATIDDRRAREIKSALNAALANTYHQLGDFSTALRYGLDALRIAEALNDVTLKNKVYTPLSTIYADLSSPNNNLGTQNDRDRYHLLAKKFMIKSYETTLLLNDERTSGTSAYNLGIFYNDENQLDSSNWFLKKAIAHGVKSDYPELLSSAYNIMAINFSEVKIDTSLILIGKSIAYAKSANLIRHQASAMLSRANLLQMSGRSREALTQAEEALKLCLQSERKVSILNAYKILSELNEETGNTAKAYDYYKKHIAIKDSLVSEENYSRIEELKTQYDVELKDKEINNLTQRGIIQSLKLRQGNRLIASLAIFMILAGGGVWLLLRQRALQQKQAMMEAEQRLNRARMNPHFFFNALTSLQQHAIKTNDGLTLATHISQFGNVMRKTLESTYQEYITIEEEIEYLQQYLQIQKNRTAESFDFTIDVAPSLEIHELLIPPMIIQPFIENSIEHGFTGTDIKGRLIVRFSEIADELCITVTDNGKGMESVVTDNNEHISRATGIIKDRLYLLGIKVKSNARFNISKNPEGRGVLVTIYLPKLFR
ncbi:MAG: histidine kinase [Cyclobacteriaceae bacterium]|nr:histidine kinase [Cyclobacteriaceae bacterium]